MMEIITAYDSVIQFYKQNNKFEEFYTELEWNCALSCIILFSISIIDSWYEFKTNETAVSAQ